MNKKDKESRSISVVTTCSNYENYVVEAVSSALFQTYKNFDIVIVNDGSTDNSHDVIRSFLPDPRIKYVRQENAGQKKKKNTGIKNASGELIAFLDADDAWEPAKRQEQIKLFDNFSAGWVVYSRARYIGAHGNPIDAQSENKYLQPHLRKVTGWLILDKFTPFSPTIVPYMVL